MNITDNLKVQIIIHCQMEYPKEACGFIVEVAGEDTWFPCENADQDPVNYFSIRPTDYIAAEAAGKIKAVVHSHTLHPTEFSDTDRKMQKKQGIPWLLVGLLQGDPVLEWLEESRIDAPLYGREYTWGVHDCYSFVRDYYNQNLNIVLPDYTRTERFWEKGEDLYRKYFQEAGFIEIEGMKHLKEHDALIINLGGTSIPSHGAIYVGGNVIAHHILNRLSCKEVYGRFYQARTVMCLRHKELV